MGSILPQELSHHDICTFYSIILPQVSREYEIGVEFPYVLKWCGVSNFSFFFARYFCSLSAIYS